MYSRRQFFTNAAALAGGVALAHRVSAQENRELAHARRCALAIAEAVAEVVA